MPLANGRPAKDLRFGGLVETGAEPVANQGIEEGQHSNYSRRADDVASQPLVNLPASAALRGSADNFARPVK